MLLVGNLDAERELAQLAEPARAYRQRKLPAPVAARLAAAATLLRVLGRDGDAVWTPAPVAASRIPSAAGIAKVSLQSGALAGEASILAWAETPSIAAARTTAGPCTPMTTARANDRRLSHALARELGVALPGSRVVTSIDELETAIDEHAWVLKAPLAAAARLRLRRRGALDQAAAVRAERLLALCGALIFEPWVQRLHDAGVCGWVGDSIELLPPHRLLNDDAGVFCAIDRRSAALSDLEPLAARMTEVALEAGRTLAAIGYRGPFGIDGFMYRDASGNSALAPLSEINARHSFGHLAARLGAVKLVLGRGAPPPAAKALLVPDPSDATSAWIEH